MPAPQLSPQDRLLARAGAWLRQAMPPPVSAAPDTQGLSASERAASVAMMRVNHAGEIAAQGLYQGQALLARSAETRAQLLAAAAEERQHLQWCSERLAALGSRPSRLTPFWYAGSVAIGAVAGLSGDRRSLGFVAETERQVSAHLDQHLAQLPKADAASRAVLSTMRADEARHGDDALAAGGELPPPPVQQAMRLVAGVMKTLAPRW